MRRRTMIVLGAAGMAAVAAVVAVWFLRYRTDTTTTPLGIEVAVSLFHEEGGIGTGTIDVIADGAESLLLPEFGVYSYTTTGSDGIDALGGASHRYPAVSTITVTRNSCGVAQRWVAAEERWDEWVTCAARGLDDSARDGVILTDVTTLHRFFGQDEREVYSCEGTPRPIGAAAGTMWATTCTKADDGEVQAWRGEVIGSDTLTVGSQSVAVQHVAVTIDDGVTENAQRTETWYLAGTDLVIRRIVDNDTTNQTVIGEVHYVEHYEIMLDSLTPAR